MSSRRLKTYKNNPVKVYLIKSVLTQILTHIFFKFNYYFLFKINIIIGNHV